MERDGDGIPLPERAAVLFGPADAAMAVGELDAVSAVAHDFNDPALGADFIRMVLLDGINTIKGIGLETGFPKSFESY